MPFVVRAKDLQFLRALAPADREVSFAFNRSDDNLLYSVQTEQGDACFAPDGAWSNHCGVSSARGFYGLHSHPQGNRVSSADFVTAIEQHPEFGGTREYSAVLAPLGVFHYRPTATLLQQWGNWTGKQRAAARTAWKEYGLRTQPATQRGDVASFLAFFQSQGFDLDYRAWDDMTSSDEVLLN